MQPPARCVAIFVLRTSTFGSYTNVISCNMVSSPSTNFSTSSKLELHMDDPGRSIDLPFAGHCAITPQLFSLLVLLVAFSLPPQPRKMPAPRMVYPQLASSIAL
ncbi:uncharacterized protein FOMMEDRAFT_159134 [Fomitiporia mediterranea MF3/22]|uniref:uncharacterized protein n=1 Tax=Fomitiporia mediterranea (strain MF3/22) TaxID=694068 RepID=UPI0004408C28|nr:uncharacterized protein FOMMEDRAFT_159134 [Fomitiporia mediterranea MF3/22]EJD00449.1 hypothetical protein FOMMEDRAFT_159134 [Fomitiporia mediterranea MF3/22]